MPLLDRDFVDADPAWRRRPDTRQLLAHVYLVEVFDRVPIKPHFPRHVADRHRTAQAANLHREPQRVFGVGRQKIDLLVPDPAGFALHAAHLEVQINFPSAAPKVARAATASVIETVLSRAASATHRFF